MQKREKETKRNSFPSRNSCLLGEGSGKHVCKFFVWWKVMKCSCSLLSCLFRKLLLLCNLISLLYSRHDSLTVRSEIDSKGCRRRHESLSKNIFIFQSAFHWQKAKWSVRKMSTKKKNSYRTCIAFRKAHKIPTQVFSAIGWRASQCSWGPLLAMLMNGHHLQNRRNYMQRNRHPRQHFWALGRHCSFSEWCGSSADPQHGMNDDDDGYVPMPRPQVAWNGIAVLGLSSLHLRPGFSQVCQHTQFCHDFYSPRKPGFSSDHLPFTHSGGHLVGEQNISIDTWI